MPLFLPLETLSNLIFSKSGALYENTIITK